MISFLHISGAVTARFRQQYLRKWDQEARGTPFNIYLRCSFNPRVSLSLPASCVNEGLMKPALVQRLADLRATLNYLAAGNLLLPEALLPHCIRLLLQLLRKRTMRPEDANARELLVLYVAARYRTAFASVKLSRHFYFNLTVLLLLQKYPLFNSIVVRNEIKF